MARKLRGEYAERVAKLKAEHGVQPGIAVILVGDNPASQVYVRNKVTACNEAGDPFGAVHPSGGDAGRETDGAHRFAQCGSERARLLVQLPLPPQIDVAHVLERIDASKDVDGFHLYNVGGLITGNTIFPPCTPYGVQKLLEHEKVPIEGQNVVVVGASNIVGKPMALMLMQQDATVAICHKKTRDLAQFTRLADILVVAAGVPGLIKEDMVTEGVVVIDVGINRLPDGRLVGGRGFRRRQQEGLADLAGAGRCGSDDHHHVVVQHAGVGRTYGGAEYASLSKPSAAGRPYAGFRQPTFPCPGAYIPTGIEGTSNMRLCWSMQLPGTPAPDSATGLTSGEAGRRLAANGPNAVQDVVQHPVSRALAKLWAPVPWMLEAAVLLQLVLGEYVEASAIAFLLVFNAGLAFFQEGRAQATLDALKSRLPLTASTLRDGAWKTLPASALVQGDLVKLSLGAVVPADVRLINGSVLIDQSMLTGESCRSRPAPASRPMPAHSCVGGEAVAEIVATGARTKFRTQRRTHPHRPRGELRAEDDRARGAQSRAVQRCHGGPADRVRHPPRHALRAGRTAGAGGRAGFDSGGAAVDVHAGGDGGCAGRGTARCAADAPVGAGRGGGNGCAVRRQDRHADAQ